MPPLAKFPNSLPHFFGREDPANIMSAFNPSPDLLGFVSREKFFNATSTEPPSSSGTNPEIVRTVPSLIFSRCVDAWEA